MFGGVPTSANSLAQSADWLKVLHKAHGAQSEFEHLRYHYIPAMSVSQHAVRHFEPQARQRSIGSIMCDVKNG